MPQFSTQIHETANLKRSNSNYYLYRSIELGIPTIYQFALLFPIKSILNFPRKCRNFPSYKKLIGSFLERIL